MSVAFPALAKRMNEVLNEKFGGNKSEFARNAGIQSPSANAWLEGKVDPKTSNLVTLSNATGINLLWLATGEGQKYKTNQENDYQQPFISEKTEDTLGNPVNLEEFVFIPQYEVFASAGHGYNVEDESPRYPVAFRRSWLKRHVPVDFTQLSIISVKGDSMEGVLSDRDTILVNHTRTNPADGIYVIRMNNDLFVKRTQVLPNSKLKIISENEMYQSFEIKLNDENQDFAIIGKVEAFFRKL